MSLFYRITLLFALVLVSVACSAWRSSVQRLAAAEIAIAHLQGEICGEVTADSAILQSRLTQTLRSANGDVPGAAGVARFEIALTRAFEHATKTEWLEAAPEHDYIVKTKVTGLSPQTKYYYRLQFGTDREHIENGPCRTFRTLPSKDKDARIGFVVVTGMNYSKFHAPPKRKTSSIDQLDEAEKALGYPALVAIRKLGPDFFIGTGDNVYYDHPRRPSATTTETMRKKWHEQFVQPRYVDLFAEVPTYWEKDDHDHRYNDNDNTGSRLPSSELGIRIFREQMPVVDPLDPQAVTYRTFRAGRHLQFWLLEGRDYRSPNLMPDGPKKTIWGKRQREWLQRTLLESDATFKLVVSPTPMIGPDDRYKKDNHTNIGGFRHEGTAFFDWAQRHGLLQKGLYFLCGDRHWQYHAIHPAGFEEFSCGTLVDANARLGVAPGAERSTDREALIRQPYTSPKAVGGFLYVVIKPGHDGKTATLQFVFYDKNGNVLYQITKTS